MIPGGDRRGPDGHAVDLYDWQLGAAAKPGRWATGWEAYVDEHQPNLLRVLQVTPR